MAPSKRPQSPSRAASKPKSSTTTTAATTARVLKHTPKTAAATAPKTAPKAAPKPPKAIKPSKLSKTDAAIGAAYQMSELVGIVAWRMLVHGASVEDAVAEVVAMDADTRRTLILTAAAEMTPELVEVAQDLRESLADEIAKAMEPAAVPADPGPPSEWVPFPVTDDADQVVVSNLVRIIAGNTAQEKSLAAERKKAKDRLLVLFRDRKVTHALVAGRPMFIYRGNSGGRLDVHLLLAAGVTADQIAKSKTPDSPNFDVRFADMPTSSRATGPEDGGQ